MSWYVCARSNKKTRSFMLAGLITYTISAPVLFQFICLCPQNWKCFEYIKFLVLINLQEKRGGGSCFKSRRNDCRSACVFEHPLYDPSTEQLSLLQSLFEPMQLPSFLPVAASVPLKSVGRHKKKPIETIPWCETEAPLLFCSSFFGHLFVFSSLVFAKSGHCPLPDITECFETPPVIRAQSRVRAVILCAPSIFVR